MLIPHCFRLVIEHTSGILFLRVSRYLYCASMDTKKLNRKITR